MALTSTYNPQGGASTYLQGSSPSLQTTGTVPTSTTSSIGLKATSPTTNVTAPKTTLTSAQTALKDLSSTYALVNGTVYNKSSQTKFATPQDFFKDSGVSNFNVKFDTAYTPSGKETVYGQPQASPTVSASTVPSSSSSYSSNTTITPTYTPPQTTPVSGQYTPPNQGTTGVSQGGIIGNLINTANTQNPNYTDALKMINDTAAEQTRLGQEGAQANADILSRPEGLSQQTGQQGILAQLIASKQAALAPKYNAAVAQLGAANTQTGTIGSLLSSAGGLNAPITNPQTGGLVSPSVNTTTRQTTSGAANLNSLIGQRPSPSNPNATEYYNTQTNQGFSSPQQLADFVNQQLPNSGATAQNVFSLLQSQNTNQVVQPNDPYYQTLQTFAQLLASNQPSAVPMGSLPPAVQAQVLQMAQAMGYNANTALGTASAQQSNVANQQTAGIEAAKSLYLQKYPEAANLYQSLRNVDDAGNLVIQNTAGQNINPFTFVPLNTTIADARRYFSSTGQATFDSNIINLRNLVQALTSSSGGNIPSNITDNAQALINGSLSMGGLQALITAAKQEGQLRFNNALGTGLKGWNDLQSGTTPLTNSSYLSNNTTLGGLF